MTLASHLQEKHLSEETRHRQEIRSTPSLNISEGERRPGVTIVTKKITGPTTIQKEQRRPQQQSHESAEAVKNDYLFCMIMITNMNKM